MRSYSPTEHQQFSNNLEVSTIRRPSPKGIRTRKQPTNSVFTTEGDNLDLVASSDIDDNATSVKRKRGRPRKDLAILSPAASSSVSSRRPGKASRNPRKSASPALSDNLEVPETKSPLRRKKSASSVKRRKSSKEKEKQELCSSSTSKPRKSRKRLEVLSPPTIRRLPSKGTKGSKKPANSVITTEGENLDLVASSEIEDNATSVKRKRGRPRKDLAILSPGASSSASSPRPGKVYRNPKKARPL